HARRRMDDAPFRRDELLAALKVLEAIAADRSALAHVDRDERLRLLEAAGRVSLPNRAEQRKLAKAFRRRAHLGEKAADEVLLDPPGTRPSRRAPVSAPPAPPALPEAAASTAPGADEASVPDGGDPQTPAPGAADPELGRPRKCYVCKAEYRRLHA